MMVFAAIIAAYAIAVLVVPTMRAAFLQQRFMTMPLERAYQTISWLCWVPNLIIAEWLILRRSLTAPIPEPESIVAA